MENIQHTKWDTFIRNITFTDKDDSVIDLTGSTILFTVKKDISDAGNILQEPFVITDAVNWLARVQIDTVDMGLDIWDYYFDIQYTDSIGIIRTTLKGAFLITYEITT